MDRYFLVIGTARDVIDESYMRPDHAGDWYLVDEADAEISRLEAERDAAMLQHETDRDAIERLRSDLLLSLDKRAENEREIERQAVEINSLKVEVERLKGVRLCYVRFGEYGHASTNHLTGHSENGVSVYEAIERGGRYDLLIPAIGASVCVSLSGVLDRDVFEVSGEAVGRGSDGEPLLRDPVIVAKLIESDGGLYRDDEPEVTSEKEV